MTIFALSSGHKLGLGLVALAWVVFSLAASLLIPRYRPTFPGKNLPAFLALCALFFVAMLAAVAVFGKESEESSASPESPGLTQTGVTSTTSTEPATTSGGATVDLAAGKAAWEKGSCGGCHVLAAANGQGNVGPNLDQLKPDEATTLHQVENGGGAMPAFKGILSPQQIQDVSAYVAQVAGKQQ